MPSKSTTSVENNFTKGLITESTGLNFPENAATDTDNCEYTVIGDVLRRLGIDFEDNFTEVAIDVSGKAVNTYKWNNAGGNGITQMLVVQAGLTLHFFDITASTNTSPISAHKLSSTVDISPYLQVENAVAAVKECQFADGNGYLFVFHPNSDPLYCSYNGANGLITVNVITLEIRDFIGAKENPDYPVDFRPTLPYDAHIYNLQNQGWSKGTGATAVQTLSGSGPLIGLGLKTFDIPAGLGFTNGDIVSIAVTNQIFGSRGVIAAGTQVMSGTVIGYSGTTLSVSVYTVNSDAVSVDGSPYSFTTVSKGYLNTWNSAIGNFPSNSDVWWYFKNASGVFDPVNTIGNVTLSTGNAPRGHYILNAFNQWRSAISGVPSVTNVVTNSRPKTGAWFQGRVWYAGVDDSIQPDGTTDFYSWASNIYFSQIINGPSEFGNCYQVNDPTSENLNGILPTDGGVVVIPEAGSIYKLFPIQNGLLVFAANGVWFITGSQGIGFAANDYTITKISSVPSISGTSFVEVLGLPYFWNEDGIYAVTPQQGGALSVQSITVGTIDSFYDEIPTSCKKLARGSYNPLDFTIQWSYRDIEFNNITESYKFNRILNFNVFNKAFFPYSISISNYYIAGINFISGPGGLDTPSPAFRYLTIYPSSSSATLSYEKDEDYLDWQSSGTGVDYESYFVAGYKLQGDAQRRFQIPYVYMFSRTEEPRVSGYKIQGIWDYASTTTSGRWSRPEIVKIDNQDFNMQFRRHKIRGMGLTLQIKIKSVTGIPFDIMGWSVYGNVNTGV